MSAVREPAGATEGRSVAIRTAVIAALAIAVGALFLALYTLALGDPIPHRLNAAGASVARVFATAAAANPQVRVVDTHPLPSSDPGGLDVFYLVVAATILGFLTVFQVRMNAGGLSLRNWAGFVLSFGLAAALALVLLGGPLLHRLALPVLESWGILTLQLITVAAFASTMAVLIGRWAILPTFLLFMVVGTVAALGRDRHESPGRRLLPLRSAWAPGRRAGSVGGDVVRRDACPVPPAPGESRCALMR